MPLGIFTFNGFLMSLMAAMRITDEIVMMPVVAETVMVDGVGGDEAD